MIPSGLASAICGTSSRKIAAFFCTRSMRVSPGFWAAPAAITVTAAPRQSETGPAQTRAVRANGTACMRSIASPSAFRSLASDRTISDARPESRSPKAKVEPTAPVPTTATRVGMGGRERVVTGDAVIGAPYPIRDPSRHRRRRRRRSRAAADPREDRAHGARRVGVGEVRAGTRAAAAAPPPGGSPATGCGDPGARARRDRLGDLDGHPEQRRAGAGRPGRSRGAPRPAVRVSPPNRARP